MISYLLHYCFAHTVFCYEPTDPVLETAGTAAEWSCRMSGDPSPGLILTPTHARADVPAWPWPTLIPVEAPGGSSSHRGSKGLHWCQLLGEEDLASSDQP